MNFKQMLFVILTLLSVSPCVSSGVALLTGVLFGIVIGNPFAAHTAHYTTKILQLSVIGLGAGMNLVHVAKVGSNGIGITALGIILTLTVGLLLGRLLKIENKTSLLLTSGTAICGGSAIAAVAATIRAGSLETSVSLATVFILNAIALFIFPWAGHYFDLTQSQFGIWSALAIHDTSSVVGASLQYGPEALTIATTTKLARALWLVPLTFCIGLYWNRNSSEKSRAKKPWFILGFLVMAALVTWVPVIRPLGIYIAGAAKHTLVLSLFLIGSQMTKQTLKQVGFRPFLQGIVLWILVIVSSLKFVLLS